MGDDLRHQVDKHGRRLDEHGDVIEEHEDRLTKLERWRYEARGALKVLALVLGGGGLVVLGQFIFGFF